MIDSLLNTFLFCSHRRTTFPITVRELRASSAERDKRTYVVCLSCGQQFLYDWENMRIVPAQPPMDFSIRRRIRSWSESIGALSLDRGLGRQYLRSFNLRALPKQSSPVIWIKSALDAMIDVLYLEMRSASLRVQRRYIRRGAEWLTTGRINARIQAAIVGLQKIASVTTRIVKTLKEQWRLRTIVGTRSVKATVTQKFG